jgi:Rap guanine nucleotide exchange factor 2
MNNLADKLPLNARYYLKSNHSSEQFLSDSLAVDELLRDANIAFLQLDPPEIAAQLTLRDYCLFKTVESTEYIDFLYKIKSKYGCDNLKKFSNLSNEEMFWVIHEILREPSLMKRVKIIKHFIHIAKICKECKNFNSLLAILSGLDHITVSRLKETWEKVSPKYKKLFEVNFFIFKTKF